MNKDINEKKVIKPGRSVSENPTKATDSKFNVFSSYSKTISDINLQRDIDAFYNLEIKIPFYILKNA